MGWAQPRAGWTRRPPPKLKSRNDEAKGIKLGKPGCGEDEKDLLSNIIKKLKDTCAIELTEDDRLDIGRMHEKLIEREDLRSVMTSGNTLKNMSRLKMNRIACKDRRTQRWWEQPYVSSFQPV